ncbi:MAG: maleylpyruvate isomerase N-terminal domain-containing protein [Cyclobacteriaceae bacterium]|nr:maleylpyruvate isomerase N-terminal domain-containing protein [Cyclobacteriaceae bacterium]
MTNTDKIDTLHLFPLLEEKLMELLNTFSEKEWDARTVAKLWTVKDIAAHLLDGNLRGLSVSRDKFYGISSFDTSPGKGLIEKLNELNMVWTKAATRLSPQILIQLLERTGREYYEHLLTLNPWEPAVFPVAWAGHESSPNWFHIAREFTEKFLHQQQIRDAVGKQGIMTKELFYPFMDILMFALPNTFKNVTAETGTMVSIQISSKIGGRWNIVKGTDGWILNKNIDINPHAMVIIDPDTAWKLFSKSWSPEMVLDKIEISGNSQLGKQALKMVAVMA